MKACANLKFNKKQDLYVCTVFSTERLAPCLRNKKDIDFVSHGACKSKVEINEEDFKRLIEEQRQIKKNKVGK